MKNVVILTVTGVLSQGVGFVYRILLTRMAGAEILGLYQLLLPVYAVLLSLTSAGLTTGVSNLSARYQALGDLRAVHQVRGQAVGLFLLLCLPPCLLAGLFSDGISVWLLGDARTRLGLLLLLPCLVLTGIENLQKHYFYGTGRVLPAALTELLEQLLRAGLILGLLRLLRPATAEGTVGTIVLGMALCEVTSALTQTALFRWAMGPKDRLPGAVQPPGKLRRELGRIALPLGAAALLANLLSSANALLIPRLLVRGGMDQGEAVAAYGVCFGMTLPMLLLPTAFLSALGLVLTPRLAQGAALGDRRGIRVLTLRALSGANRVLVPALALLAVLGDAIGAALYREPRVGEHLPLLALGVLLSCWQSLFSCVLSGLDRQGVSAAIALACDGAQLALTLLTVERWGLAGYGLSFVLSSLAGALLTGRAAARAAGLEGLSLSLGIPALGACLAAAGGDLMETALLQGGLDALPAALGALVFGLLLYLGALEAMGEGVSPKSGRAG